MAGLAAGGVLLGACGGDDEGGDTTAATQAPADAGTDTGSSIPTTTISNPTLGYNNPNAVLRAPIFVGQSLGYFAEVGIESINVNNADDPIPPTIAGDYNVALYDSDVLFDFNEKEDPSESIGLKMISINLGAQPLVMVAREGVTVDNLDGKIVGGGREGQVNEALAKFMLEQLGFDWQTDVDFRNLTGGSNDWVTALLSGQVDATIAFPRHIPVVEAEGGSALYQDFLIAPQGGFGMSRESMEKDPNFAAAWNHAYIKAQRYCKTLANKEEVRRIVTEEFGEEFPDNNFQVYDIPAGIMTQDLGWDPADMDSWMDFVAPFGNVPEDINDRWRNYVDVSGLHVAQAALGLDLNPSADLSSGQTLVDNL